MKNPKVLISIGVILILITVIVYIFIPKTPNPKYDQIHLGMDLATITNLMGSDPIQSDTPKNQWGYEPYPTDNNIQYTLGIKHLLVSVDNANRSISIYRQIWGGTAYEVRLTEQDCQSLLPIDTTVESVLRDANNKILEITGHSNQVQNLFPAADFKTTNSKLQTTIPAPIGSVTVEFIYGQQNTQSLFGCQVFLGTNTGN